MTKSDSGGAQRRPMAHVELQILLQLAEKPCHGYEMMKEISRRTDGAVDPGPGTLYVALRRLVDSGRIRQAGKSSGATGKRAYRLTKRGEAALEDELARPAEILRRSGASAGGSRHGGTRERCVPAARRQVLDNALQRPVAVLSATHQGDVR